MAFPLDLEEETGDEGSSENGEEASLSAPREEVSAPLLPSFSITAYLESEARGFVMHEVRVKAPPYDDEDDDERTTPDSSRIKREPEDDDDEDDPAPLPSPLQQQDEPQQRTRVPWVVPPRRNLLRKTDAATGKAKRRRPCHTKNAFHLDLRNKWSQLLTDKISALAFARALEGHRCS